MSRLPGKVAFVTGGAKGIGQAVARRLAEEGAVVYIMDIRADVLQKTAAELRACELQVHAVAGDVTRREDVERLMERVVDEQGRLDILVNNAGVIRDNLIHKMTDIDWDLVMDVHLKGMFLCSQTAQRYMVSQRAGKIVNISSTSALGNRGQANYATAKAGVLGFTKTLAIELGPFGIQVNAVAPGFIETDMTRAAAERMGISFGEMVKRKTASIPLRRPGKPLDVAHAVLFFASDESDYISGQVLYVRGGP